MKELPTLYQQYITKGKYARWRDDLGRRETWEESVDRFIDFIDNHLRRNNGGNLNSEELIDLQHAILNLEVSPSMRAFMTAGPALEKDHVAAYNCAYVAINRIKAFSELLYILCCGTGIGFSVERQHVNKLPEVPDELYPTDTTIVVSDSKIGWATAFDELLRLLWGGKIPNIDTSKVRKAGERLKTFGGRASGPEPLEELFRYTIEIFRRAAADGGRKLTSDECHGIVCKIGDIVVAGGVRRSALLSLFNPSDERMLNAKNGRWYDDPMREHFALANNSAAWTEKPDMERFLDKWVTLVKGKSGEPGIFNRQAAQKKVASIDRDPEHEFGVNPCGEIILRDRQFCNLSEVTVRPDDTFETLAEKVRIATILGTIQATFTNFRFLSKKWQENCEEEALLGVSFTGTQDHPVLSGREDYWEIHADEWTDLADTLVRLREVARETNRVWAHKLNINPAAAITCVKPSGNNSQRLGTASGMHDRYGEYYIRTTRENKADPFAQFLYTQGIPAEDEIRHPETTWVFSWPQKAPQGAVTRHDRGAIEQLGHWLVYAENWCDHNPSITIHVKESEWLEVGAFVYKHFDKMCGITFLPAEEGGHIYKQAPYTEVTADEYEQAVAEMPDSLDWSLLADLEKEDHTTSAKELACVSGSCEI